ncbi:MAG: ANTAR domain-containing response regulator [Solirubrobacteraceae bacterium]
MSAGAIGPEPATFRITLADEDEEALRRLAGRLEELGHDVTGLALSVAEGIERIAASDPELVIVVRHDDDRHALDLVEELGAVLDGPVVVLVDPPPARFLVAAADRGVTAFATSSDQEELQGALEVGVRLHAQRAALEARVATLTRALDRRATIEQAKGVLMERHGISADEAHVRLRGAARSAGSRVADIAGEVTRGVGP